MNRIILFALCCALALPFAAFAQDQAATDDVFTLGQIAVTEDRPREALDAAVVTRDEMPGAIAQT